MTIIGRGVQVLACDLAESRACTHLDPTNGHAHLFASVLKTEQGELQRIRQDQRASLSVGFASAGKGKGDIVYSVPPRDDVLLEIPRAPSLSNQYARVRDSWRFTVCGRYVRGRYLDNVSNEMSILSSR